MQLSLMIEPVEVDNLQITVSQGIKTSAPHDSSCDGCNFLLLALSSMKVMHLSTYCDYDNSCDGIASRSLNILHFS